MIKKRVSAMVLAVVMLLSVNIITAGAAQVTAGKWTVYVGNWKESNGKMTTTGNHSVAMSDESEYGDFSYTLTVRVKKTDGWVDAGPVFRAAKKGEFASGYYVGLYPNDGYVRLYKFNAPIKDNNYGIKPNKDYKVTVSAVGTDINVYIDDKLVINYKETDKNAPLKGYIGIRSYFCPADIFNVTITAEDETQALAEETPDAAEPEPDVGGYGYAEVIPPKYAEARDFSEGLAVVGGGERRPSVYYGVQATGGYGYIDKSGVEVIPLKYMMAWSFSEGLAAVANGNWVWGYIDKLGNEVLPFKYSSARSFSEGLAAVENGNWGFIDKSGKEVVPPKYDAVDSFSDGLALVGLYDDDLNILYGYIDKSGNEVIPLKFVRVFVDIGDFFEGLATVYDNGKFGYIDKSGNEVIPPKYDAASDFSEGLAAVRIGDRNTGKWGFIDKSGKEVLK